MVLALGIARDLGAHDPLRVGLRRGPSDPPDMARVDALDFERAGARAIVRADAGDDVERQGSAPAGLAEYSDGSAGSRCAETKALLANSQNHRFRRHCCN